MVEMLERYYRNYLEREPGFEKWFRDPSGRNYVVLVGSQNCHCIARDTLEDEAENLREGMLAIGQIDGEHIDIFTGPLMPLAEAMARLELHHALSDKHYYRFMYEEDWKGLCLTGKGGPRGLPWMHAGPVGEDRDGVKIKRGRSPSTMLLHRIGEELVEESRRVVHRIRASAIVGLRHDYIDIPWLCLHNERTRDTVCAL